MHTSQTIVIASTLFLGVLSFSCSSSFFSEFSSNLEEVSKARASDQTNVEDSLKVFFASFPNPYPDKEFLWFASFVEGAVEMHVHNTSTDSIEAIYRFDKQDIPVHTIAFHRTDDRLVKCVLLVDGRMKCAKVYPAWYPIPIEHWKTRYAIEHK